MPANGVPVPGSVYIYAPNKIAPAIFAVAFLATGLFHLWQCIHYKSFRITALHPFCCLLFVIGFALREYGSFNYSHLNVYIASQILIFCAPPILELANYHVLGRILFYVPYFAPLHPGRTLTTFGFVSGIVEMMNAIGVSYIANKNLPENLQNLGHILMKASLIVQVVVMASFCLLAGLFHRRCLTAGIKSRNVQGPLTTLYLSSAIILTRTIYRIVEHFTISSIPSDPPAGYDPMSLSPILRYEWYFYVFEASLMLVNEVLWNDYHVYLAQDGRTELVGPGWKDDQPWVMSFIDPFGFVAMCARKGKGKTEGKERPFWEANGFHTGTKKD
ncbi:RTA1 domain protein [Melanomma pulvis-pyrius CBS 109.77]|uniref:RTA1 domain protein n=1 Tax=Melanomma pulvis-pyrius CBS 109.77 TaxID=1314802 RepID=A0A6A6XJV9_9PLEO|nr:RTA1 domain protein [Melanomma pulvis-pyrius CBS 109.77]